MTQSQRRRLDRLEVVVSEQRRLMRERVERVAQRLGATLTASEMDDVAARHMRTPARIQAWRRAGLTDVQILERLERGLGGGGA
jgi:hypothetical protein